MEDLVAFFVASQSLRIAVIKPDLLLFKDSCEVFRLALIPFSFDKLDLLKLAFVSGAVVDGTSGGLKVG